jgi:hypothetical protein
VGHVCEGDSYRYGQIDYAYQQPITQRANLTTPELGHIFGCNHAASSITLIMSPSIYDGELTWDQTSINSIRNILAKNQNCFKPNAAIRPAHPSDFASWESLGGGYYRLTGTSLSQALTLTIGSLQGQVARRIVVMGFSGSRVLGLGALPAGNYLLRAQDGTHDITQMFQAGESRPAQGRSFRN